MPRGPLRHPIIFHDLIFNNKKLQIGFPLTQASICRLRARAVVHSLVHFSFRPFAPFHPLSTCRSIPFGRPVTSQSVLVVLGLYRLYYVSVSPVLSPFPPISALSCSRRMKSAKGHRECDERANVRMCRSRNHLIVVKPAGIAGYRTGHISSLHRVLLLNKVREFAANSLSHQSAGEK